MKLAQSSEADLNAKYTTPCPPPPDAVFINAREAAYTLRVSYKTILEFTKRKKNRPPMVWIGKHSLRFPRQEFIAWASKQGR